MSFTTTTPSELKRWCFPYALHLTITAEEYERIQTMRDAVLVTGVALSILLYASWFKPILRRVDQAGFWTIQDQLKLSAGIFPIILIEMPVVLLTLNLRDLKTTSATQFFHNELYHLTTFDAIDPKMLEKRVTDYNTKTQWALPQDCTYSFDSEEPRLTIKLPQEQPWHCKFRPEDMAKLAWLLTKSRIDLKMEGLKEPLRTHAHYLKHHEQEPDCQPTISRVNERLKDLQGVSDSTSVERIILAESKFGFRVKDGHTTVSKAIRIIRSFNSESPIRVHIPFSEEMPLPKASSFVVGQAIFVDGKGSIFPNVTIWMREAFDRDIIAREQSLAECFTCFLSWDSHKWMKSGFGTAHSFTFAYEPSDWLMNILEEDYTVARTAEGKVVLSELQAD